MSWQHIWIQQDLTVKVRAPAVIRHGTGLPRSSGGAILATDARTHSGTLHSLARRRQNEASVNSQG